MNFTFNVIFELKKMATFEQLLDRLKNVQKRGKNFVACCPAHDDKNPSLSVTQVPDGRILIKCWAGCDVYSILTALGFDMSDLFPNPIPGQQYQHFKSLETITARSPNSKLDHEKRILEIAKADREAGKRLSAQDLARERLAYERVKANGNGNR